MLEFTNLKEQINKQKKIIETGLKTNNKKK